MVDRLTVINRANLDAAAIAEIESEIPQSVSLNDVVKWTLSPHRPLKIVAAITPDEFTHDIAINWGDGVVLVFGAT